MVGEKREVVRSKDVERASFSFDLARSRSPVFYRSINGNVIDGACFASRNTLTVGAGVTAFDPRSENVITNRMR
jgi:hypothetical protein